MNRDISSCNTYNYGDALYWDTRYLQEGASFDWYQRYSALRPFMRMYIPTSSRILVVGCGNAVMSEDMVNDGYEDIVNIDISPVAIDMMRRKYEQTPQLKYMQMDVRDMSFFPDESFRSVIDKGVSSPLNFFSSPKLTIMYTNFMFVFVLFCCHHFFNKWSGNLRLGTLDSLMCGSDGPICSAQMLGEVSRLLKPGGVYMLITYGDPTVRMPHLNRPAYDWKILLYIIPRPGFERPGSINSSTKPYLEPVPLTDKGSLSPEFVLEDPESHFIYVCKKMEHSEAK